MTNKKRILLVVIFAFVLTFISGTYAYWEWVATEDTRSEVTFTATPDFICSADGGGNLTSGSVAVAPSSCVNSEHAIMREIVVDAEILETDLPVYMDMWLDIDSLDTELSDSQYLRYALTTSSVSCTEGVISSGTFNGKSAGDKLKILGREFAETGSGTYYLYIWLDSAETSVDTAGKSFGVSLNGKCSNDAQPEAPVLDNTGLIPVTITDGGVVTTISESDSDWYNYSNKNWANAVLVSSSSRSKYHDTEGVTVSSSDILAYYVWIPRFKYAIWTTGTSSAGNEESIDIVFEGKEVDFSLGTSVGTYRTHPAFWWDGDNDSVIDAAEKLAGIWVGKFETTGSSSSPTVLPNSSSLRNQNVSAQFTSSKLFSSSDSYGLSAEIDSHMMKNGEWGAVAYLTHSQYGINGEVRYNNNSSGLTGCGASTEDVTEASTSCQIAFAGASSYPQSTTGNVTGVFDMAGGGNEYVMGNYNGTIGSSGFTTLPAIKYYDKFTTMESLTACSGGICFGHALSETANWYSDNLSLAYSDYPWLARGGHYENTSATAGIFYATGWTGTATADGTWRSVLINLPTYVIGYNANGGTGAPDGTIKVYGENIALSSTVPTRTNYSFVEWNTKADGTGTSYAAGGTYTDNAGITLYAIWRDATLPSVSITISNNVETQQDVIMNVRDKSGIVAYYYGTTNPESSSVTWTSVETTRNKRVDLTISDTGTWYFAGKDEDGNVAVINQEFYKTTLSVTNATVDPAYVITAAGNRFILPRVVVSEKYNFSGWHTDSSFSGSAVTVYQPTGNTTLYGKVNPNIMTGGVVTIKGTNTIGETLTAEITTPPTPDPTTTRAISYTYQWYYNSANNASGGTAIDGATDSTYTIGSGLTGKYIYVIVTAHLNNYFDYVMDADFTDATNNTTATVGGYYDAKVGSCITNLSYNGSQQTIASGGANITFSNHQQTNAGSYTVTMTAIEDHFFEDGAKSKTMTCSISKVTPIITLGTSTGTVDYNSTKSVNVTVSADTSASGTLKVTSGNTSYVTITNPSSGSTSVTMGTGVTSVATSFTYKGIQATETDVAITLNYTPTDTTNINSASATYTVTAVNKIDNTLAVTAKELTYTGSAQSLVTATNAQGTVYYSTSTALLSSNYSTDGSTTIPTGTNAGSYTVYYYTPGNTNYKAASGSVEVTIDPDAWPSLSVIITGTATYGSTLSLNITSTPSNATYTYQWYANSSSSTSGGTLVGSGNTLSLNSSTFAKYIYVVVTASESSGNYHDGTATDLIDTVNNGSATVIARPITITANSSTKTYDGTALTNSTCTLTSGSFYATHGISSCTMTSASTITQAGSVVNDVSSVSITNSSGTSVNTYYNITLVDGTLTVNKRAATITANSQTIDYGTSISTGTSYITATNLASGDSVTSVTLTPSTTTPTNSGTITASNAVIKNNSGVDVTSSYNLTYEVGTLVIQEPTIPVSVTITGTNTYGETLTANATSTISDVTYAYQWYVTDNATATDGTAISNATSSTYKPTSAAFDSSYNGRYLYVVVTATKQYYKTSTASDITDAASNTTAKTAKRNVTITAGSTSKVYDGIALTNSTCTRTSGTMAFSQTLDSCTMTSASTITDVGSVSNVIDTVNFSEGKNYYNITTVAGALEVTKASYDGGGISISGNLYYGETLTATITDTNPVANYYTIEWFATDSSTATGGTSVGTGNTLSLISSSFGKYVYVKLTASDKANKVEGNYYNKEFTAITASTIGARPITITADSNSKVYDGTALTDSGCTLTSGSFIATHGISSCTMTSASTITNVGSVDNEISSVSITNSSGTSVKGYYDVTFVKGTLTVTCASFTGGSVVVSGTNTYGNTLTATVTDTTPAATYSYQWYKNASNSTSGGTAIDSATSSTLSLAAKTFIDGAGAYIYVVVTADDPNYCDGYNFKDITDASTNTNAKTAKRAITVTADSNSKVYDGTALTDSGCTLTSGTMAFSQTISSCTMTSASTITNVGSVSNVIDTVNLSSGGAYYTFTKKNGTLTVTCKTPNFKLATTSMSFSDTTAQTSTITYDGDGSLSCSSSNSAVATCKVSGKTLTVTPVADGDATITVSASGGTNFCSGTNQTVSVSVDMATTVNDKRYVCEVMYDGYDNTNRLSIYDVTTCSAGTCNYDQIHGLDSSYDHSDNLFDVTWTVDESTLKDKGSYSSIGAAVYEDEDCDVYTRYIDADFTSSSQMNCRAGASSSTAWANNFYGCEYGIYVQRVSKRVGSTVNNWWYATTYDCYLDGTYLFTSYSEAGCSSSSSSSSGDSVVRKCNCAKDAYYGWLCTWLDTGGAVDGCYEITGDDLPATCSELCTTSLS